MHPTHTNKTGVRDSPHFFTLRQTPIAFEIGILLLPKEAGQKMDAESVFSVLVPQMWIKAINVKSPFYDKGMVDRNQNPIPKLWWLLLQRDLWKPYDKPGCKLSIFRTRRDILC